MIIIEHLVSNGQGLDNREVELVGISGRMALSIRLLRMVDGRDEPSFSDDWTKRA